MFIAFFYLLNGNNFDFSPPVEQNPKIAYPQPIAVAVADKRFDLSYIWHVRKHSDRYNDLLLKLLVEAARLSLRASFPLDGVHREV
jgi:hypothetical protein